MIRYSLACDNGHEFEGWFGSSDEFDTQQKRGFVACPQCGSVQIEKRLMAPNVATGRRRGKQPETERPPEQTRMPVAALPQSGSSNMSPEARRAFIDQLREMKRKLLSGAEDVGERFSEEARKIHYGEAEARGIHGKASLEEAASLAEEGIDFLPLPELPEEKN